jgi:hypothetical protein
MLAAGRPSGPEECENYQLWRGPLALDESVYYPKVVLLAGIVMTFAVAR